MENVTVKSVDGALSIDGWKKVELKPDFSSNSHAWQKILEAILSGGYMGITKRELERCEGIKTFSVMLNEYISNMVSSGDVECVHIRGKGRPRAAWVARKFVEAAKAH